MAANVYAAFEILSGVVDIGFGVGDVTRGKAFNDQIVKDLVAYRLGPDSPNYGDVGDSLIKVGGGAGYWNGKEYVALNDLPLIPPAGVKVAYWDRPLIATGSGEAYYVDDNAHLLLYNKNWEIDCEWSQNRMRAEQEDCEQSGCIDFTDFSHWDGTGICNDGTGWAVTKTEQAGLDEQVAKDEEQEKQLAAKRAYLLSLQAGESVKDYQASQRKTHSASVTVDAPNVDAQVGSTDSGGVYVFDRAQLNCFREMLYGHKF